MPRASERQPTRRNGSLLAYIHRPAGTLDRGCGRTAGQQGQPVPCPGPPHEQRAPLQLLRSTDEELELLAALVDERIKAGTDPGDIAVLVDVKRKGDDAARVLSAAGIPSRPLEYEGEHADGVLVGTLNRAKGLEFKEVFIPGLAASEWPSRWFVPPDLPEEQRQERIALQLAELRVGGKVAGHDHTVYVHLGSSVVPRRQILTVPSGHRKPLPASANGDHRGVKPCYAGSTMSCSRRSIAALDASTILHRLGRSRSLRVYCSWINRAAISSAAANAFACS